MAATPTGDRIFVTGFGASTGPDQTLAFVTAAYDAATGNQLWESRFQDPGADNRNAWAIAVNPDGSQVYVAGHQRAAGAPGAYDFDYVVVAYSAATGQQIWTSTYNNPVSANFSFDSARFITSSPDGHTLYVGGFSTGDGTRFDFATLALAADNSRQNIAPGTILWVARYDGGGTTDYLLGEIAVSGDGTRLFVHGDSGQGSANTFNDVMIAYDAVTGNRLWASIYDGGSGDTAWGMALAGDLVIGAGMSVDALSSGSDIDTIAYDAQTGVRQWVARYSGLTPAGNTNGGLGVAADPQGQRIFVTGQTLPLGGIVGVDRAIVTLAYDKATGLQEWSDVFTLPGRNAAHGSAVVVNPDGTKAYVVAQADTYVGSGQCLGGDYVTIAYDAAGGNRLWAGRIPRAPNTLSSCLAIYGVLSLAPDASRLYMAGTAIQQSIGSPLAITGHITAAYAIGVQVSGVVSRKTHGNAGTFDVDLPLTGPSGIECRRSGANGDHKMVFKFVNELTSVGGASASATQEGGGNQSVAATGSINPADRKEYIVNLSGVPNAQVVTVNLANVNDSAGNSSASVSASMGVLIGDTNGDGTVNSGDAQQTRSRSGQLAEAANFRSDVNLDGTVNSGDAFIVRSKSGTALP